MYLTVRVNPADGRVLILGLEMSLPVAIARALQYINAYEQSQGRAYARDRVEIRRYPLAEALAVQDEVVVWQR
jgi:hypothetical protein